MGGRRGATVVGSHGGRLDVAVPATPHTWTHQSTILQPRHICSHVQQANTSPRKHEAVDRIWASTIWTAASACRLCPSWAAACRLGQGHVPLPAAATSGGCGGSGGGSGRGRARSSGGRRLNDCVICVCVIMHRGREWCRCDAEANCHLVLRPPGASAALPPPCKVTTTYRHVPTVPRCDTEVPTGRSLLFLVCHSRECQLAAFLATYHLCDFFRHSFPASWREVQPILLSSCSAGRSNSACTSHCSRAAADPQHDAQEKAPLAAWLPRRGGQKARPFCSASCDRSSCIGHLGLLFYRVCAQLGPQLAASGGAAPVCFLMPRAIEAEVGGILSVNGVCLVAAR